MRLSPRALPALPLLALLVLGCGRGNDTSGPGARSSKGDGTGQAGGGQVQLHVKGMH
jgi:hypothetical protein